MVNELVPVMLLGMNNDGGKVTYNIADATAVSKGQLLAINDGNIVTAATLGSYCAGVAAEEHIANEGSTTIPVWTDGIFRATASGAVTAGRSIHAAHSNKIMSSFSLMASPASGSHIIGYAIDTLATNTAGDVRIRL